MYNRVRYNFNAFKVYRLFIFTFMFNDIFKNEINIKLKK